MKWIKGQLVLNNIEKIGSVVKTIPGLEELSDDDSGNVLKIIILSNSSREEVCEVLLYRSDSKSNYKGNLF